MNGGFCSVSSDQGPYVDASKSDNPAPTLATQLSCPLCSTFAAVLAINTLAWALDYVRGGLVKRLMIRDLAQPPPRYIWPALNPRASPHAFFAVTFSA